MPASLLGIASTGAIMLYKLAAEAVLLIHLAFILFVLLGAAIAARWRWIIVFHLPAATWGFFIEITGRICPLTYLENYLRTKAGLSGYTESFVEHYVLAIIYPVGLTREIQFVLSGVVLAVNIALYSWLYFRKRGSYGGNA
jgi:Protein of Unknown function (DUF2784)